MRMSVIYSWINFSIFLGALIYFLKSPLRDFLGDRRESLKRELDEVAAERLRNEGRFQEYRKRLAQADSEIEELKKELKEEGELEKIILMKKAKQFAEKIREDASRLGIQELRKAKQFLKEKVLLLAVEVAREMVEKSVESKDQERLFEGGIQQLERMHHERKSAL